MKKLLVSNMLMVLLATNILAVDLKDFYFGGGYSTGSGETTAENQTTKAEATAEYDSSSMYYKIGYMVEDNQRIEFSYVKTTHEFTGDTTVWGTDEDTISSTNVDFIFTLPTDVLKPYVLIGLGIDTYDNTGKYFVDNIDLSSVSFDFGFGTYFLLTENVEFDLGYKAKTYLWQDYVVSNDIITLTSSTSAIYFGVNIHFN